MDATSANRVILLIEDNLEDHETMLRALKKIGTPATLYCCTTGDDAIDFLLRKGKYLESKHQEPHIILLDLNLPGTDGREILQQIKCDEKLKLLPVIVLSTSSDPSDLRICYESGANSYIVKPIDFKDFINSLKTIEDYWFKTVLLPNREEKT